MGIKQKLEQALCEIPQSNSDKHKILNQLKDVVLLRQDCDLPSAVILKSRMNPTSVKKFLHNDLGIQVQGVKFLPYSVSSGEKTYQVELCS